MSDTLKTILGELESLKKKVLELQSAKSDPLDSLEPPFEYEDTYFFIDVYGYTESLGWYFNTDDKARFAINNAHTSEKEALDAHSRRVIQTKLERLAKASGKPISSELYVIEYYYDTLKVSAYSNLFDSNPRFATKESAEEAICIIGEVDLKFLFGVEA